VIIRNFEYLLALHQERHFSRAATLCSVAQPTLSAGIKQLEEDMGVQIVKRGRRFEGLTPEGERVLAWAQQMLDDCQRLKQELYAFREQAMDGPFNVGLSPATTALASVMSIPFAEKAPAVKLSIETMASDLLPKALRSGQIDIALSYLNELPEEGLSHHLLYREQMLMLSPEQALAPSRVTLEYAVVQSLCLLRSALPFELEARLSSASSIMWTDSMMVLGATLATGRYATIIPQTLTSSLASTLPVRSYTVKDPKAQANVGFITLRTNPMPPLEHLWIELAHTPALVKSIRALLNSHKAFAKK
jgi:DNA-binding transcriptional LysR family regulator